MRASREAEYTEYVLGRLDGLKRVAFLLCRDQQSADDLVQRTITRLYTHWGTARSANSIDAYLRTILMNQFLSDRKSAWSRKVTLVETPADFAGRFADHDAVMDVRQALQALPPRQRATIVLRYYYELNVDEVAKALGVSDGTVKSQTAKAINSLRGTLTAAWSEA